LARKQDVLASRNEIVIALRAVREAFAPKDKGGVSTKKAIVWMVYRRQSESQLSYRRFIGVYRSWAERGVAELGAPRSPRFWRLGWDRAAWQIRPGIPDPLRRLCAPFLRLPFGARAGNRSPQLDLPRQRRLPHRRWHSGPWSFTMPTACIQA
jgi:hypothetical protein